MGIATTVNKPFPSLGDQVRNITWQVYNDPLYPLAVQVLLPRITGTILHAVARVADCALSVILAMSCVTEAIYHKTYSVIYPATDCQQRIDELFQRTQELSDFFWNYLIDIPICFLNLISPQLYQEFFMEEAASYASPIPGFKNPGANCAFNSCLQVLLHHPGFRQVYEIIANYYAQIDKHKTCGENMLSVLKAYDHAYSSKQPVSSDISQKMRLAIHHLNPQISASYWEHEDANEIFLTLIEKYENILKEAAHDASNEEKEEQLLNTSSVHFKNVMTKHFQIGAEVPRPNSIPSSLNADNTLVKEEIQCQLKIMLNSSKSSLDFSELLQEFFSKKEECLYSPPQELSQGFFSKLLQWFFLKKEEPAPSSDSPKLMKEQKCFKVTLTKEEQEFSKRPNHLIIQFARFIQTEEGFSKINTSINAIPEEINTSSLCIKDDPAGVYELTSFITHEGNLNGGHYIAYVKKESQWIKCNDHTASYANETAVLENLQKSYLCFYKLKTE